MTQSAARKTVFLTGATGNWGRYILREFAARSDRFDVVALVLPGLATYEILSEFEDMPNLTTVLGDLTNYASVETCVRGADYVLHVGAVVSPVADDHPELAHKVNVGGARNIIRAVKAQPSPGSIGVVMIGTVAQTGDRNPPRHWGRIGDPLRVAQYDEYGQSKIVAEKELIDSGLPKWAWLRQTGIFHPGVLEIRDPIITHSPFDGVMEWVSVEDAARLLANICEDSVPPEFWGGVYNIGGGSEWRLTNWELQERMTAVLGVRDVRKRYERNWFATRNFHGQWYTDSDALQELVPFRQDTFEGALSRAIRANPRMKMAGRIPPWLVKNLIFKPITLKDRGTMAFIRDAYDMKTNAYFGSRGEWEAIGDWSTFVPGIASRTPTFLDHGYDESKETSAWTTKDMVRAAEFRGGRLLSKTMKAGDVGRVLQWECGFGHTFDGSPRLILSAGHWCPVCVKDPAGYRAQAAHNEFLAQLETRIAASSPIAVGS